MSTEAIVDAQRDYPMDLEYDPTLSIDELRIIRDIVSRSRPERLQAIDELEHGVLLSHSDLQIIQEAVMREIFSGTSGGFDGEELTDWGCFLESLVDKLKYHVKDEPWSFTKWDDT